MMTKAEFISNLRTMGVDVSTIEGELENFEGAAEAAAKAQAAMPGIGFASTSKRMNCFIAVCRHIDSMIENGEIDLGDSQIVLNILRMKDKRFLKAITMFDIRGTRYGARDRAEMPKCAREYLAGIEMYQINRR